MVEEELFEIQAVTHRPNLISFSWTDLAGMYKVYRDQELLYEGTVAEFNDGDFNHAKIYSYVIERLVDEKVVNVIALQTTAFAEEKNAKNPLQSLVMTTIVAKTQISLSWEEIPDIRAYEIYRNGELLKVVKGNSYIDRNFSVDKSYVYQIHSKRSIEKSPVLLSGGKSIVSSMIGIFKRGNSRTIPRIEKFTISKFITSPENLLKPIAERSNAKKIDKWTFRYTTFLHEAIIDNPNKLSSNRYFKGDNRDFNPDGESFRTRVTLGLDYQDSTIAFRGEKEIGQTIAYDRSKKIRQSDTASDEKIEWEHMKHKVGEEGFTLTHSVGNPLTTAPPIDYDVQAVLRQNGTFDVTGFHDQAPHHEVYLDSGGSGRWSSIHQAKSEGLLWMSGVTGWQYWRASNFE